MRRVWEGEFSAARLKELNDLGYNIYFLPNYPSTYTPGVTVDGTHIDVFQFVFVDMDLKEKKYESKEAFYAEVLADEHLDPTFVVDSGNGVHAYWQVSDLDAMSFLRLQRRLMRKFHTDEAVGQIYQLMRAPGTINTKDRENPKTCEYKYEGDRVYTCEQLDALLPPLLKEDEDYCQQHYDKTYNAAARIAAVDDKLPLKFGQLMQANQEVKDIWSGNVDDRSKGDYRLGHILFASGFTKDEARSVLVNCAKAIDRAPVHRIGYADSIIDKIWTFETEPQSDELDLSQSVRDILSRPDDGVKALRFQCWKYLDDTVKGFKLGHVIGLVAGSGVGKTAFSLNMFEGFVTFNPDFDHFFVSLEQPREEIAERWRTMCGENSRLHDKVHIIDNYDAKGTFRDLSLETIKDYIIKFKAKTGRQVGCVVIDHIGVLCNEDKLGQDEGVKKLCKQMKTFALQTNTILIMQSQTSREKAGIGDLELNKDAAFGTSTFENYTDFLITIWQPIKRCYPEGAPPVTAFKFCKIRHKRPKDTIKEDVRYAVIFDGNTERLRALTQDEDTSFSFFKKKSANMRAQDRKTELVEYTRIEWPDAAEPECGSCNKRPCECPPVSA